MGATPRHGETRACELDGAGSPYTPSAGDCVQLPRLQRPPRSTATPWHPAQSGAHHPTHIAGNSRRSARGAFVHPPTSNPSTADCHDAVPRASGPRRLSVGLSRIVGGDRDRAGDRILPGQPCSMVGGSLRSRLRRLRMGSHAVLCGPLSSGSLAMTRHLDSTNRVR